LDLIGQLCSTKTHLLLPSLVLCSSSGWVERVTVEKSGYLVRELRRTRTY
jgi:hypothetical protein